MGIKNLNRYLTNNCNNESIMKVHLSEFSGQKIVVDASIYLYRFIGENKLIEHMYLMISIFLHYNITPIFVFDGAAPLEKKEVLLERRENKRQAQEKYELLKQHQPDYDTDEMEKLKKQFLYIKDSDYSTVKSILDDSGIAWITATGEADELCAHLIHSNQVYACLSDDMDMFAYGCVRILRHFSLVKHNVLFYDLSQILSQLQINIQEFRQILVLSGTDYNKDESNDLYESFNLFVKFKKEMVFWEDKIPTFYEWLLQNTNYIQNTDKLYSTLLMFKPKQHMKYVLNKKEINKKHLIDTLATDGFIFP
jgi:5'-3' exonuclease